jgi:DNA-binding protein YbaB
MATTQEKIEAVKIAAEVVNDQDRVEVQQIVEAVKEVIRQTDQTQE